jgi:hypothetical protein
MHNNINENSKRQDTNNNREVNKNDNKFQKNLEEPENPLNKKELHSLNNKVQSNILNEKKILFPDTTNRGEKNKIKSNISNPNENSENKIFKVIYRPTHNCHAKDNIRQSIVTSFINFLLSFINNIVFKKLNKKGIFIIGCEIKTKIKLADIKKLKVKEILTFQSKNIINNKNEELIQEIIKQDSSLNKILEIPAIFLFKDIYYNKEKIKQIDLKKYEIEGLNFEINEEIQTYEKLKESFKDNQTKVKIMDEVIQNFVSPQKFNISKKSI